MKKLLLLFPVIFLLLISCEHDFIEDDLSGKMVTILAPAGNDTVTTSMPLFWWNEIAGARSYRLQIVYPGFYTPQQLLYDTAVVADRFYPVLTAGYTYEWRIRPENGSSEGDWVTRRLTIDSAAGIENQSVVITNPAVNGMSTQSGTINFTWNVCPSATLYRLEITNVATGTLTVSATTALNTYSVALAQGSYEFRVRAENNSSFTPWALRTFAIDQSPPVAPVPVFPADDAFYTSVPLSIAFDWTNSTDAYMDSLFVATDSTFSTGIVLEIAVSASQNLYSWSAAQAQTTYFWRVRSTDAAGNLGNYSNTFRFVVN